MCEAASSHSFVVCSVVALRAAAAWVRATWCSGNKKSGSVFWMAVLALYESSLAHSQDPAPREGRLMTASHGKALQRQRVGEKWKKEDGEKGGWNKSEEALFLYWSGSDRCESRCVSENCRLNGLIQTLNTYVLAIKILWLASVLLRFNHSIPVNVHTHLWQPLNSQRPHPALNMQHLCQVPGRVRDS